MLAVHVCSQNFKSKSPAINGKAANDTLEGIDEPTDEQLVNEPDDGVADEVETEDTTPTQPRERLPQLKGVTMLCGWAIHGIFCNCSEETVEMPATASDGKVKYVLPIRTMKSTEIEQEEYDEFYKSTVNNKYGKSAENTKSLSFDKVSVDSDAQLLDIYKEILQQHLLQMIDQKKTPNFTQGHPLIREMLWWVEDNPTDKNASDMVVKMFDTATHKSVNPLDDTINPAHQIGAMMRQTPETDNDEMIDEEEEVPDEEPPEDHVNKKEGEMAPLDALYPKMRVSTTDEKQQTLHRMTTMPVNTYKEAVKNETYMGNKSKPSPWRGR
jgi:hypothetical protein